MSLKLSSVKPLSGVLLALTCAAVLVCDWAKTTPRPTQKQRHTPPPPSTTSSAAKQRHALERLVLSSAPDPVLVMTNSPGLVYPNDVKRLDDIQRMHKLFDSLPLDEQGRVASFDLKQALTKTDDLQKYADIVAFVMISTNTGNGGRVNKLEWAIVVERSFSHL
jgi:hypothetical protein